jgi:hypothetical protein
MDKWKWLQPVCMGVVYFMSPMFQIANRKFNEKGHKGHNYFFWMLSVIWILAGVGLAVSTFKDYTRVQRTPAFGLLLNRFALGNESLITLPLTNGESRLETALQNVGNLPTEHYSVFVQFPKLCWG